MYHLERAHDLHRYDAEIIYNMVELSLLEKKYRKASELINFFHENKDDLEIYDKKMSFYESKMKIFSAYITTYETKKKAV